MDSDKQIYQIPDGYLINHLLQGKVGEDKCYIFQELNNVSLRRIIIIAMLKPCIGTDECCYCVVNHYAKEEMRSRRPSDPHCFIYG